MYFLENHWMVEISELSLSRCLLFQEQGITFPQALAVSGNGLPVLIGCGQSDACPSKTNS